MLTRTITICWVLLTAFLLRTPVSEAGFVQDSVSMTDSGLQSDGVPLTSGQQVADNFTGVKLDGGSKDFLTIRWWGWEAHTATNSGDSFRIDLYGDSASQPGTSLLAAYRTATDSLSFTRVDEQKDLNGRALYRYEAVFELSQFPGLDRDVSDKTWISIVERTSGSDPTVKSDAWNWASTDSDTLLGNDFFRSPIFDGNWQVFPGGETNDLIARAFEIQATPANVPEPGSLILLASMTSPFYIRRRLMRRKSRR